MKRRENTRRRRRKMKRIEKIRETGKMRNLL